MLERDPRVVASEVLSDELRAMRGRGQKARRGGFCDEEECRSRLCYATRRRCRSNNNNRHSIRNSPRRLLCLRIGSLTESRARWYHAQAEIEAMYAGGGGGGDGDEGQQQQTLSEVVIRKIVRGDFL